MSIISSQKPSLSTVRARQTSEWEIQFDWSAKGRQDELISPLYPDEVPWKTCWIIMLVKPKNASKGTQNPQTALRRRNPSGKVYGCQRLGQQTEILDAVVSLRKNRGYERQLHQTQTTSDCRWPYLGKNLQAPIWIGTKSCIQEIHSQHWKSRFVLYLSFSFFNS